MLPDLCLRKVLRKMLEAIERCFLTARLETREDHFVAGCEALIPVLWESTLSLSLLLSLLPHPFPFT